MIPKKVATKPTTKTPWGHANENWRRGFTACVSSSSTAPAVVEDPSARETLDDKILAALSEVTEILAMMESSHRVREEDERMLGAFESGMFASKLGANLRGRPMTIDALGSPEVKPAALHHRAPNHRVSLFASLNPSGERLPPQKHV